MPGRSADVTPASRTLLVTLSPVFLGVTCLGEQLRCRSRPGLSSSSIAPAAYFPGDCNARPWRVCIWARDGGILGGRTPKPPNPWGILPSSHPPPGWVARSYHPELRACEPIHWRRPCHLFRHLGLFTPGLATATGERPVFFQTRCDERVRDERSSETAGGNMFRGGGCSRNAAFSRSAEVVQFQVGRSGSSGCRCIRSSCCWPPPLLGRKASGKPWCSLTTERAWAGRNGSKGVGHVLGRRTCFSKGEKDMTSDMTSDVEGIRFCPGLKRAVESCFDSFFGRRESDSCRMVSRKSGSMEVLFQDGRRSLQHAVSFFFFGRWFKS